MVSYSEEVRAWMSTDFASKRAAVLLASWTDRRDQVEKYLIRSRRKPSIRQVDSKADGSYPSSEKSGEVTKRLYYQPKRSVVDNEEHEAMTRALFRLPLSSSISIGQLEIAAEEAERVWHRCKLRKAWRSDLPKPLTVGGYSIVLDPPLTPTQTVRDFQLDCPSATMLEPFRSIEIWEKGILFVDSVCYGRIKKRELTRIRFDEVAVDGISRDPIPRVFSYGR